jgi:hypothetical protein
MDQFNEHKDFSDELAKEAAQYAKLSPRKRQAMHQAIIDEQIQTAWLADQTRDRKRQAPTKDPSPDEKVNIALDDEEPLFIQRKFLRYNANGSVNRRNSVISQKLNAK